MTSPLGEGFEIPYHDFGPQNEPPSVALVGGIPKADRSKEETRAIVTGPRNRGPSGQHHGHAHAQPGVAF
jgi:hypothetical protein